MNKENVNKRFSMKHYFSEDNMKICTLLIIEFQKIYL